MIFNGVDFSQWMRCNPTRRLMPEMDVTAYDRPGGDGAAYAGSRLKPLEIPVHCRLTLPGWRHEQVAAVRREVAAALSADAPAWLELGDEADVRYLAKVTDAGELSDLWHTGACTVTFTAFDPVAFGRLRSATVPSGGSVDIDVGGTWPTWPTLAATSAVRDSTTGLWGVTLDSGDHLRVVTGTASAVTVAMDCAPDARTCLVGGAVKLPTPDSDWLRLSPGKHTVAMDKGTGAAVLTWYERWL